MTSWRCRFTVPLRQAILIEEGLAAAGIEQFSSERHPGERALRFSCYAADAGSLPSEAALAAWLAEAGADPAGLAYEAGPLPEQDWNEGFRRRFARRRVSELAEVLPPWERDPRETPPGRRPPGPGAPLALVIHPGQAFGTGEHPTTRGCLARLGDWCRRRGAPFDSLDVGHGTGILTIAARLWGAGRAEGYDTDPACIVSAYLNADLNGLAGQLRFRLGEARDLAPAAWDLILCNLFLAPILRLLPRLDAALRPGGSLILSGFLDGEQAGLIDAAARARGWRAAGADSLEGWAVQEWLKAASRA